MNEVLEKTRVNGIDVDTMKQTIAAVAENPSLGLVEFRVRTDWTGSTRSESTVESYSLAGERIDRRFKIIADEPFELLGTNSAPNPQELLMSALNSCMMVGYVAQAAMRGISLTVCRIETQGGLDLRGFLGIDPSVPNGYREIDYVVTLEGNGTREQFEEIHDAVQATSPNFYNLNSSIRMNGRLA
jgi:uncharacterized OsmC-like protein